MHRRISTLGRVMALVVMCGTAAWAQSPSDSGFSFKFRLQGGMQDKVGVRNGLGFGVNYDFKMGPGSLGVEAGYQYWAGDQFRDDLPPLSFGATANGSVNSKKASVQGIMARVMYRYPLASTDWALQGGLAFGNLRSNIESVATYSNADPEAVPPKPATAFYGSWALSTSHTDFSVNPYIGATYNLSQSGSLELNLMYARYKQVDVDSVAGATAYAPVVTTKQQNTFKLEVGYVFHF